MPVDLLLIVQFIPFLFWPVGYVIESYFFPVLIVSFQVDGQGEPSFQFAHNLAFRRRKKFLLLLPGVIFYCVPVDQNGRSSFAAAGGGADGTSFGCQASAWVASGFRYVLTGQLMPVPSLDR